MQRFAVTVSVKSGFLKVLKTLKYLKFEPLKVLGFFVNT